MHNSQLPEIASGITRISYAHVSRHVNRHLANVLKFSFVFRFIAAVGKQLLWALQMRNAHEANETNPSKVIALVSVSVVRCALCKRYEGNVVQCR